MSQGYQIEATESRKIGGWRQTASGRLPAALAFFEKTVDARHKAGHDERERP
jgi:hypothetical protein